jgi:hypothetical protein
VTCSVLASCSLGEPELQELWGTAVFHSQWCFGFFFPHSRSGVQVWLVIEKLYPLGTEQFDLTLSVLTTSYMALSRSLKFPGPTLPGQQSASVKAHQS